MRTNGLTHSHLSSIYHSPPRSRWPGFYRYSQVSQDHHSSCERPCRTSSHTIFTVKLRFIYIPASGRCGRNISPASVRLPFCLGWCQAHLPLRPARHFCRRFVFRTSFPICGPLLITFDASSCINVPPSPPPRSLQSYLPPLNRQYCLSLLPTY